jgi:hypothetical protein
MVLFGERWALSLNKVVYKKEKPLILINYYSINNAINPKRERCVLQIKV